MAVSFEPEPYLRDVIELRRRLAFSELAELVPDALLEHVGSTAVPGGWTDGVVDVQVRVERDGFAAAQKAIAARFASDGKPTGDRALFRDDERGVRLHVTVIGGEHDDLREKRDLMRDHPLLRDRYDALRRRHQRSDDARYKEAKDRFWKVLLAP